MAPIRSTSKGKWLPGTGPGNVLKKPCAYYPFFCEPCNRGFYKGISYERHLSTELHFNRKSKTKGIKIINSYDKDPDFFEKVSSRPRITQNRLCKKGKEPLQLQSQTHKFTAKAPITDTKNNVLTCPTCYSKVNKHQIGKHLISHFHWQAASGKSTLSLDDNAFILNHIHEVVRQSPFQCYNCKYYFTNPGQLTQHFQKYHLTEINQNTKNEASWSCSSCFEPSTLTLDNEGMFKHLNDESHRQMEIIIGKSIPIIIRKISLFSCDQCDKKFSLRRRLFYHVRKSHSHPSNDNAVQVPNDQCFEEISKGEGKQTSKFQCPTCSYSSLKKSHHDRHIKTHDSNREKPYKCQICPSQFFEKYALKFHQKTHDGKQAKCEFPGCDFHGRCESDLNVHKKIHEKTKQFLCDLCNFSSKTKFSLTRHKTLLHKQTKGENMPVLFACDHCNFNTKLKHILTRHLKTHEGPLPSKLYYCPECSYKSRDMELVRKHFIGNGGHKGCDLYKCKLCLDANSNPFSSNLFSRFKSHISSFHKNLPPLSRTKSDGFLSFAIGLVH